MGSAQLISLNPITFMAFSEITLFQRFKIKVFGLTPIYHDKDKVKPSNDLQKYN